MLSEAEIKTFIENDRASIKKRLAKRTVRIFCALFARYLAF